MGNASSLWCTPRVPLGTEALVPLSARNTLPEMTGMVRLHCQLDWIVLKTRASECLSILTEEGGSTVTVSDTIPWAPGQHEREKGS